MLYDTRGLTICDNTDNTTPTLQAQVAAPQVAAAQAAAAQAAAAQAAAAQAAAAQVAAAQVAAAQVAAAQVVLTKKTSAHVFFFCSRVVQCIYCGRVM